MLVLCHSVPQHVLCCYNLTYAAIELLLVLIHVNYAGIELFHNFKCEQEPVFSYRPRAVIEVRDSGLLLVAYTDRVFFLCAALLMAL